MSSKVIPIVYCGNSAIFEGIFLSAISVTRRTKSSLEFYIYTADLSQYDERFKDISDSQCLFMEKSLQKINPNTKVIRVDLKEDFFRELKSPRHIKSGFTPYALLRLFMDNRKNMPHDKAIYLDADTMLVKEIDILYDIDINEYEFAATIDAVGRIWVARDYCNSGVILFNLKNCRETHLFENARKIVDKKHYFMPDQTALHKAVSKKYILGNQFNEQVKIEEDTVIRHFNNIVKLFPFFHIFKCKPWERDKVHKKLKTFIFDEDYALFDSFYNEK